MAALNFNSSWLGTPGPEREGLIMTKLSITAGLMMSLGALAGGVFIAGCAFDAEPEAGDLAAVPRVTQGGEDDIPVYIDFYDPIGYLDGINSGGAAFGWACDKDGSAASIEVHFWSQNGSTYFGKTVANQSSEAAVNTSCGGGAAHRFTFQLPVQASGVPVNAWGIDLTAGSSLLIGSPRTWIATDLLEPTDDAWVEQANPTATHGADSYLYVRSGSGGAAQRAYLKYDLSGIPGTIQSAHLLVRITPEMQSTSIHRVDHTSWTESTLSWNTASIASIGHQTYPSLDASGFDTLDVTYQVTLTPSASNPDFVTLGIAQEGTTAGFLLSKESSVHPRLLVAYTYP
jgi:hypothetical protein